MRIHVTQPPPLPPLLAPLCHLASAHDPSLFPYFLLYNLSPHRTLLLPPLRLLTSSLRRPVLGFCLGHQVMAQALGGLVRPRTGHRPHYALQESELLVAEPPEPASDSASGSTCAPDTTTAASPSMAVAKRVRAMLIAAARESVKGDRGARSLDRAVQRQAGGREGEEEVPRMKLLYHHGDEVGPDFFRWVKTSHDLWANERDVFNHTYLNSRSPRSCASWACPEIRFTSKLTREPFLRVLI